MLAIPLLRLPDELSGTCELAFSAQHGAGRGPTGAAVTVKHSRIVDCTTRLPIDTGSHARGTALELFTAIAQDDLTALELDGNSDLPAALLREIHRALFVANGTQSRVGLDSELTIHDD